MPRKHKQKVLLRDNMYIWIKGETGAIYLNGLIKDFKYGFYSNVSICDLINKIIILQVNILK